MSSDDGAVAGKRDFRMVPALRYLKFKPAPCGEAAQAPQQLRRLHYRNVGQLCPIIKSRRHANQPLSRNAGEGLGVQAATAPNT
jgi:hypothetical protein